MPSVARLQYEGHPGGRELIGDFVIGSGNEGGHFGDVRFKDFCDFFGFEPFDG